MNAPRCAAVLVLSLSLSACADNKKAQQRLELPAGAPFKEALFTTTAFDNAAMLGPVGGPTQGYDAAIELWPEGPRWLLFGRIGKEELKSDPVFQALRKGKLSLKAAPDGHALAYSYDGGATWFGVWLDAHLPFSCHHGPVNPASITPTRTQALDVLQSAAHEQGRGPEANRGDLMGRDVPESNGALSFALARAADGALFDAAVSYLQKETEEARSVRNEHGTRLGLTGPEGTAAAEKLKALDPTVLAKVRAATKDESDFWEGVDKGGEPAAPPAPSASAPSPGQPCTLGPAKGGALPATLTPLTALDYLGFPKSSDPDACAHAKALAVRFDKERAAVQLPPRPSTPAPSRGFGDPVLRLQTCPGQVGAVFTSFGGMPLSGRALDAIKPLQQSYEHEVLRCGHVGQRDKRCEERVKKEKTEAWLAAVERVRVSTCPNVAQLYDLARECISAAEKGEAHDAFERAQATQLEWMIVSTVAGAVQQVSCPLLDPPHFDNVIFPPGE